MDAPRRSRRRIGVLVAASWLGAAVLTGTIAWRAVAVLDTDTPRTGVLSDADVSAALASARAAAQTATPGPTTTGAPTPSEDPTTATPTADPTTDAPTSTPTHAPTTDPSPSTTRPAPSTEPTAAEVTRTWQVTGGTVSAACTGQTIRKVYATPQDGWTVETGSSGPEVVEVELHRGEQETKVTARCVGGTPTATVSTGGDDEHSSEHDD
jgi:hypothetical protein